VANFTGTSGDDVYSGGPDPDLILGNAGNDTLSGGDGNDTIAGDAGADAIDGGNGDDFLISGSLLTITQTPVDDAGREIDHLSGGAGNDMLAVGYGDSADGGGDMDRLSLSFLGSPSGITMDLSHITGPTPTLLFLQGGGTIQNIEILDHFTGTLLGDTITVGTQPASLAIDLAAGNDKVIASGSTVDFLGGAGADTLVSGTAPDHFDGGDGFDTADYSGYGTALSITLGATNDSVTMGPGGDTLVRVEQILGTEFADSVTGGNANDAVAGNAGHDIIAGGDGSDTLDGGNGNDHLWGQSAGGGADGADSISGGAGLDYLQGNAGNDTLDGGNGADRIYGGANDDTIQGWFGNDTVNGNLGNDTIDGFQGDDSLRGGQGDDLIDGGTQNDTIFGDLGNDLILGGTGVDVMTGGAGADTFKFFAYDAAINNVFRPDDPPDIITDFQHGVDHLMMLGGNYTLLTGPAAADYASAIVEAQNLFAAQPQLMDSGVAVIGVGSDTYVLWGGTHISSGVILQNVAASSIDAGDFVGFA